MTDLWNSASASTDKNYLSLRNDSRFQVQRQFIQSLWQIYEPYADKNFREEISSQFHCRFWEMYLACTLIDQGHKLIDQKHRLSPKQGGPDICIKSGNGHIWVEATAPGGGTESDAISAPDISGGSQQKGFHVPETQILLRIRSAFWDKHRKYLGYRTKETIEAEEPFVIAINGAQIPFSALDDEIPFVVQAVLPFGPYSVTMDADSLTVVEEGFAYRPEVMKKNKESVSTDVFLDDHYAGISGILFSNTTAMHSSTSLGADFIYLHNPKATNPLPLGWIKVGTEYWVEADALQSKPWSQHI